MAKNAIRRALVGVVDPHPNPSQIDSLWAFFESSCAYCAKPLVRGKRDAHVDHLVPAQGGGSNHISNCVLSCSVCNGDEKREGHWESFLRTKAPDDLEFAARKGRIESWGAACAPASPLDAALLEAVNREIGAAISAFDRALDNVRRAKMARQIEQPIAD
ncbi:MAG TPA: HNH endonuclease signature motif containing protein [Pyrinomonadaceae bacterium]